MNSVFLLKMCQLISLSRWVACCTRHLLMASGENMNVIFQLELLYIVYYYVFAVDYRLFTVQDAFVRLVVMIEQIVLFQLFEIYPVCVLCFVCS